MKKTILTAVVVALSATAHASSSQNSADGSSKILQGSYGVSLASIEVVVDSTAGAIMKSGASIARGSEATGEFLAYVLNNPLTASKNGLARSGRYSGVALTASGKVVNLAFEGSAMFVQHPINSTKSAVSASGRASAKAYRVTVDASGNVLTASGDFLADKSGEPMRLMLDGSGAIADVSVGSVIALKDGSVYVVKQAANGVVSAVKFSGETVGDSVLASVATSVNSAQDLSAGNIIASIRTLLEMPINAFDASGTGYQNDLAN